MILLNTANGVLFDLLHCNGIKDVGPNGNAVIVGQEVTILSDIIHLNSGMLDIPTLFNRFPPIPHVLAQTYYAWTLQVWGSNFTDFNIRAYNSNEAIGLSYSANTLNVTSGGISQSVINFRPKDYFQFVHRGDLVNSNVYCNGNYSSFLLGMPMLFGGFKISGNFNLKRIRLVKSEVIIKT